MAKLVRRNARRQVEAFIKTHTDVTVHHFDEGFVGVKFAGGPEAAWKRWEELRHARATLDDQGVLTIYLHGRCWYKLRQPE